MASSTPPLRTGTLLLLGLFTTDVEVQGQLIVDVDTAVAPPAAAVQLTSGTPARLHAAAGDG
jgi:microcompartment protein CcmK/EutM